MLSSPLAPFQPCPVQSSPVVLTLPCHPCLPPVPSALFQVLKDIPLYVVTEEKLGLLGTREQAIRIAEALRADKIIAS